MRSFGWYEFVGADTAVEGFPHINDVYHNISLGVSERYRAESGVTITANASCGNIRRHCLQTRICTLIAQEAGGLRLGAFWGCDTLFSPDLVKQVVVFFCFL